MEAKTAWTLNGVRHVTRTFLIDVSKTPCAAFLKSSCINAEFFLQNSKPSFILTFLGVELLRLWWGTFSYCIVSCVKLVLAN